VDVECWVTTGSDVFEETTRFVTVWVDQVRDSCCSFCCGGQDGVWFESRWIFISFSEPFGTGIFGGGILTVFWGVVFLLEVGVLAVAHAV